MTRAGSSESALFLIDTSVTAALCFHFRKPACRKEYGMKDRKSSGKKRYLLLGAVAGLLLSLGVQTYAQDALTSIAAWIRNDYRIEYNGEEQTLPEGYDILVYQDRTYLPLRYIGEMVGAEVEWDSETHTASIRREESADNPETPDISDTIDTTGYGTLPQSIETLDYRITATVLMGKDDREGARLYLSLKNKSETVLRLDQGTTVFEIDGEEYDYGDVDSLYYDNRWYTTYLEENQEAEGYLRLPEEASDASYVTITTHLTQDGTSEPIPVTFRLKME